jgi:hypothetical protein
MVDHGGTHFQPWLSMMSDGNHGQTWGLHVQQSEHSRLFACARL